MKAVRAAVALAALAIAPSLLAQGSTADEIAK